MKRSQSQIAKERVEKYLKRPSVEPVPGGVLGAISTMAILAVYSLLTPTIHTLESWSFYIVTALGFLVPWAILYHGHNRYNNEVAKVFLSLSDEDE
ncbi:hypothetical protein [Mesorhizobium sp.]|uniref:hypothetical protein n=1 Tax=Mesorhizobium sp. TaxID=1871066 RepID=UPI000FE437CD|nr:hypothetical protein [Mesorhizobium sp.]RWN55574.1 MAG: hypothetical protein EOR98_12270 [Mesorhizobium sp.]RWN77276.1 MAG: hypothetical protein EOS02_12225 [Mesorhizobium sp.]RWN80185.1 MAG: hypothetical protein EOS01_12335 [Mesorhizobium sp.]RWN86098.1 MAG: hypothetical protein EOS04_19600 [Mesorhizobium sp.]RWO15012.1 MAG: hypothetical protein EOS15_12000 [Mesorhizobium sp.]